MIDTIIAIAFIVGVYFLGRFIYRRIIRGVDAWREEQDEE
jgi:Kef-type K+ transport system membrane component KefB